MTFKLGQEIVCIKSFDDVKAIYPFINYREKGCIYTISEFDESCSPMPGLRLKEVSNPEMSINGWPPMVPSFYKGRFRPVVKKKTDISVFEQMLVSERVDA